MSPNRTSVVTFLTLCSIAACLLFPIMSTGASAQIGGTVVGAWPLGDIESSGSNSITPDLTGANPGILVGGPEQPVLTDGKFGKAMLFDGSNGVYIPIKFVIGFPPTPQPVFMPISTNLDIQEQIEINAWINVSQVKDVEYNNIVVKCTHPDQACTWQNTTRVNGLSIRGEYLQTESDQVIGALSGYVFTDSGGYNEIVTTQPVPLNKWVNIEFTRTSTGIHLYVNGYEQSVNVIHGVQNPQGKIINGTEYYIGHDAVAAIQDVQIINLAPPEVAEAGFDIGSNILIAAIAVSMIFAIAWVLRRAIQLLLIRPRL
jgi:hypothetical protein